MSWSEGKLQPSLERLVTVLYINHEPPEAGAARIRSLMPEGFLKVVQRIEDFLAYTGWHQLEVSEPFTLETEREVQLLNKIGNITYHVFTEEKIPNNEALAELLWTTAKKSKYRKTEYRDLLKRMKKKGPPKTLSEFTDEEYQKIFELDVEYIEHNAPLCIAYTFGEYIDHNTPLCFAYTFGQ